jgi:hypothetical protein
MKTIILSLIILLFGCSTKSSEEIRVEVYKLYQEARAIPASNYCGNFNSYVNLRSLEKEYRTNFYSEIT